MLNKKADIKSVTEIILALLILIVLYIVFTSGYIPFLTSSGTKEACKNWVNLQSIKGLKEAHTFESPCVTIEETIKDKDIKTENDLYKILANNMYDCWDQYGRGESDFYSDFDWGSADKYCRICSEIKVDPNLDESKRSVDLDKFEIYLSNNHPPGHRETYTEFFTKPENAKLDFGSGTLTLNSEKSLYTTFVVYKKSTPPDFIGALEKGGGFSAGGCVIGGTIVGVAGAAAGFFTTGGALSLPGALVGVKYGCAFGMLSGGFISIGYSDYLYPSITIFESGSDQIAKSCDYVYYKPQSKIS